MPSAEIAVLVFGIALAAGHRSNHRNMLLAGASVLFPSSTGPRSAAGLLQRWRDVRHSSVRA